MSINKIYVEGNEDKVFVNALLTHLQLNNAAIKVDTIEVEDLKGVDNFEYSKTIKLQLERVKNEILAKGLKKVGFIIDQDEVENNRLEFFNKMVADVFGKENILQQISTPQTLSIEDKTFELSLFIVNVNGEGELSTILKLIKAEKVSSKYADCLDAWRKCADPTNTTISQKEFDKNWYHYYLRWDNSTKDEREFGNKYCSLDYSFKNKNHIWDLGCVILDPLKQYLTQFQ